MGTKAEGWLLTAEMAAVPSGLLPRVAVAHATPQEDAIRGALDMVLSGF